ncbi:MAG: YbjN domain-containing protein [Clostridia bacterium]|nr:YbjN domain-containing protein [Clostridia bacterium]
MKKLIAALLLAVMCMSLTAPVLAETPAFETTKSFIAVLEADQLLYEFMGRITSGEEHVLLENEDNHFAYEINTYFHEDNDTALVYVWNIIHFEDADFVNVLRAVNELNYSYKYTRFYIEDVDNTVTCAMTIILHDNDTAGDVVLEALMRMASILNVAYPALSPYNK